jgi:hypothetical protein
VCRERLGPRGVRIAPGSPSSTASVWASCALAAAAPASA